ncbi:ABC-type transport system substrate-binding protein [Bradyrhizobium sp. GM24.11]
MTRRSATTSNYSRRDALQTMAIGGTVGLFAPNLLGKPALARTSEKPSGRVIVGLGQEPTVFNPLMVHIEVDDGVHFSVFDALFRIDPQGVIQPNLAVEVPNQKNGGISEDGLKWRIRLRDDVRWHDGKRFRAEDVKFTLELITNPNFRSWRTAGHALVRDITVVSPTEISWRMEEAFAPYLSFLTETFIVPKHILEKEANPNTAAFNQAPVGTGPFKWGQRVAGDHLELVANTEYFGEGPHIERLVFKYIPDLTVLYTQFKSGDVDLVGQPYITPDHYGEAKSLPNRVVTLIPRTSFESFYLNLERPQFKELAVREALYAAIDKEAIIQGLYYGVPTPTETFMPKQSFYFNANLPLHEFNLNRAGQLLRQGGLAAGTRWHSCQRRRPSVLCQLDHLGRSPPRTGAAVPAADVCAVGRRDEDIEPACRRDVGGLLDSIAVRLGDCRQLISDRR